MSGPLQFRAGALSAYGDVLSPTTLDVLEAMAPLEDVRRSVMISRNARRRERARAGHPIGFLDPDGMIERTSISVRDARAGWFDGGAIPADLRRQWIQGTGPATRPRSSLSESLRNVAYGLLSGADGWMFDGEDAMGQADFMALDSQRNLRIAFAREPVFVRVAEQVAADMNAWSSRILGRRIVVDWRRQLEVTTRIFRVRGLHLDDRNVRMADGTGFSASIVDLALYVALNHGRLRADGRSVVLYLPKIQTAEEAAVWSEMLASLEAILRLPDGTIRVYVLVEQLEAAFQLMEIRAALGVRFLGFNTGRWDYINSVSDAHSQDPVFTNPNIDAIGMTFPYMGAYEDRVRRAVNTPDRNGRCALWQGGMEAQIPVGSEAGVQAAMRRAVAGAEREQREGASGKWVAHWKMVHILRPVWERHGADNQLGRSCPALTHSAHDAAGLVELEPAPRTVAGARDLLSVALQYGNAFLNGFQATALKPADSFNDDGVLYLMEDMATGEIRLSILWEWLHKGARFTGGDPATSVREGDSFTVGMFERLLEEEYAKLTHAADRDVHDESRATTLPIARIVVDGYVRAIEKPPWCIDLLNLTLGNDDGAVARDRVDAYLAALRRDGSRITVNLDFDRPQEPAR